MESDGRLPRFLFGLLVVAAAVQGFHYYPQLGERLASHFDEADTPNGWQTKTAFFSFYVGGIVLATVLVFGIPKIISAMPASLINLPNKDYWLAPERRAGTLAYLTNFFSWFGTATLFVMVAAFELALRANLHPGARFDSATMWVILGGYFLFVVVWLVRLLTRFSKTP